MPESETTARSEGKPAGDDAVNEEHQPPRIAIRLPVLSVGEPIGLGDLLKRATTAAHLPPCAGCQRRARLLNRWVAFTPGRPHR